MLTDLLNPHCIFHLFRCLDANDSVLLFPKLNCRSSNFRQLTEFCTSSTRLPALICWIFIKSRLKIVWFMIEETLDNTDSVKENLSIIASNKNLASIKFCDPVLKLDKNCVRVKQSLYCHVYFPIDRTEGKRAKNIIFMNRVNRYVGSLPTVHNWNINE